MNEKIRKYKSDKYGNDGIDLGIILISEKNTKEILFSGAKMDLWLRQNGSLSSVKAARYAVGIQEMTATDFRDEIVKIEEESILYLFSDGITDQFGGENQKKLSTKGIEKMLAQLEGHLFEVQNEKLVKELSRWQGQNEQTDDMTLIALHLTSKNKASA
jgi:serine phosphatase RsbU (regulator of sigma subunit)